MKTTLIALVGLLLVTLAVSGCLEDKVLEIVFSGETFADFSEDEIGTDVPETAVVAVADEIRDILEENDYSISDIDSIFVTSVHYGVTSFSQSHDWSLTGTISVQRIDTGGVPTVIVNYTSQSVQGALGQKIPAPLEPAGVDVINQALEDFRSGGSPILGFQVQHGTIEPQPAPTDPMIFDWRAWLAIQLITEQTVEVPDPF